MGKVANFRCEQALSYASDVESQIGQVVPDWLTPSASNVIFSQAQPDLLVFDSATRCWRVDTDCVLSARWPQRSYNLVRPVSSAECFDQTGRRGYDEC